MSCYHISCYHCVLLSYLVITMPCYHISCYHCVLLSYILLSPCLVIIYLALNSSTRLHYQYDDLNFHGLSIAELNELLDHRKEEDRIFAQFLLHGIQTSADVSFDLCDEENHCEFAGLWFTQSKYRLKNNVMHLK